MARMHARRRGKSCSLRPYRKQAPAWSNMDAKAITKVILDLRKEGASSSKIGLVLRDRSGVPDVKLALGKRIGDILKENKVASEIPEDLRDLMIKALGLRKHLGENKKDLHNKRQLNLTESKIRRLVRYPTGEQRSCPKNSSTSRRPQRFCCPDKEQSSLREYPCPLNPSQKRLQRSGARSLSKSTHTMMQTA